jgi:peptide-methionine (S)-S-oxide reductase
MSKKTATFAAGCFWGVEETFRNMPGVLETAVGYIGGDKVDPTYEEVCTGTTGHAEAVQVVFDPDQVEYAQLLQIFWDNHNPTTPNRQGPDIGTQYRSAIFVHDDEQKVAAESSRTAMDQSGRFRSPIVTQIRPAARFFMAEDYHQQYFAKRGGGSCHI